MLSRDKSFGDRIDVNGLRYYDCEKGLYPSVTTVLGNTKREQDIISLDKWRNRVGISEALRIGKEATDRGTELHRWCERFIRGETFSIDDISDEVRPYWISISDELSKISRVYLLEQFVYNDELKYAGSLDCFGCYDGIDYSLIDFKTSSKPKKVEWVQDYFLQTVAYAAAVKRCYGLSTNQAVLIISLPNQSAQVFTKSHQELLSLYPTWKERINKFWSNIS